MSISVPACRQPAALADLCSWGPLEGGRLRSAGWVFVFCGEISRGGGWWAVRLEKEGELQEVARTSGGPGAVRVPLAGCLPWVHGLGRGHFIISPEETILLLFSFFQGFV